MRLLLMTKTQAIYQLHEFIHAHGNSLVSTHHTGNEHLHKVTQNKGHLKHKP